MNTIKTLIIEFAEQISRDFAEGKEIRNENVLQHELAYYLHQHLSTDYVTCEMDVFCLPDCENVDFVKQRIDIVVRCTKDAQNIAIELKFPRGGDRGEQPDIMFKFCKDVKFAEQLKHDAGFKETYAVIFTDDHLFYESTRNPENEIYAYFRDQKRLTGKIARMPWETKEQNIQLSGCYTICWQTGTDKTGLDIMKYAIIQAQ